MLWTFTLHCIWHRILFVRPNNFKHTQHAQPKLVKILFLLTFRAFVILCPKRNDSKHTHKVRICLSKRIVQIATWKSLLGDFNEPLFVPISDTQFYKERNINYTWNILACVYGNAQKGTCCCCLREIMSLLNRNAFNQRIPIIAFDWEDCALVYLCLNVA